jgi:hypothetical protein
VAGVDAEKDERREVVEEDDGEDDEISADIGRGKGECIVLARYLLSKGARRNRRGITTVKMSLKTMSWLTLMSASMRLRQLKQLYRLICEDLWLFLFYFLFKFICYQHRNARRNGRGGSAGGRKSISCFFLLLFYIFIFLLIFIGGNSSPPYGIAGG